MGPTLLIYHMDIRCVPQGNFGGRRGCRNLAKAHAIAEIKQINQIAGSMGGPNDRVTAEAEPHANSQLMTAFATSRRRYWLNSWRAESQYYISDSERHLVEKTFDFSTQISDGGIH